MNVPLAAPNGDTLQVPVGPFGLAFILRVDLGDATDLPVFPRLLWSIDQGDNRLLAWFVRKRAGIATGIHGMGTAMDEASGTSAARRALIAEQAKTSRFGEVGELPGAVHHGAPGRRRPGRGVPRAGGLEREDPDRQR
jgi:hypothetical protein